MKNFGNVLTTMECQSTQNIIPNEKLIHCILRNRSILILHGDPRPIPRIFIQNSDDTMCYGMSHHFLKSNLNRQ